MIVIVFAHFLQDSRNTGGLRNCQWRCFYLGTIVEWFIIATKWVLIHSLFQLQGRKHLIYCFDLKTGTLKTFKVSKFYSKVDTT